jgi:hypothetical protein
MTTTAIPADLEDAAVRLLQTLQESAKLAEEKAWEQAYSEYDGDESRRGEYASYVADDRAAEAEEVLAPVRTALADFIREVFAGELPIRVWSELHR